jgi:UDP-glucose 4-epimerase
MDILVTGGAGFIGTNLVRMLVDRGDRVRVLDSGAHSVLPTALPVEAEVVTGDVRDEAALSVAFEGVEAVVHLAASGSVIQSVEDPWYNFEVNARGTLSVLDAATKANVEKFVFASTGGALIGDATPPVDERSVPRPISPYGAGKLTGEGYCHAFARSYGLPTVALRFANVYGPYSAHKRGAVTAFIKAVMAGSPIVIYGDGLASRDFLYIDDLCRGIVAALDRPLEPGSVMHLASGVETSVNELAQAIFDVAGRPSHPIRHEPARAGEVGRNFASFDRARELLDFEPACTLHDGLARTWEWFQQLDPALLRQEMTDA